MLCDEDFAPPISLVIHGYYCNQQKLPSKQQRRAKRPRGESREMKALSCGKSLREVGTSFESGVRRSKRIKTRPLEYWKGESFLYGRVNEGLQLIGLKYISPAKGDAKLKVKSSISNFPNEILYVAACHRPKISFERYLGKGSILSGS